MGILKRFFTKTSVRTADTHGNTPRSNTEKHRVWNNKYGYRKDIPEVIEFQSAMEANLYRFYTRVCKGLTVEYEPKLFRFPKGVSPLGITGYIPDFRISRGGHVSYIEAKGRVDAQALEKAKLLKKYYPGIRLYFVTPVEYNLIRKHYAKYIPDWE